MLNHDDVHPLSVPDRLLLPGAIRTAATRCPRNRLEPEVAAIGKSAQSTGELGLDDFIVLATWKSPRPGPHYLKNDDATVRGATRGAFAESDPVAAMRHLRTLRGVGGPVASAMLHWCTKEAYPIIDRRALGTLGVTDPNARNDERLWHTYVTLCRRLAQLLDVTLRDLDRALWVSDWERRPAVRICRRPARPPA